MRIRGGMLALCMICAAVVLGGCATGPPQDVQDALTKAERVTGIAKTSATSYRDAELAIRDRANADGDVNKAQRADKRAAQITKVLPYFDTALSALAGVRGDPAAQAEALARLAAQFTEDPEIAALVATIPPLVAELQQEVAPAAATPAKSP